MLLAMTGIAMGKRYALMLAIRNHRYACAYSTTCPWRKATTDPVRSSYSPVRNIAMSAAEN